MASTAARGRLLSDSRQNTAGPSGTARGQAVQRVQRGQAVQARATYEGSGRATRADTRAYNPPMVRTIGRLAALAVIAALSQASAAAPDDLDAFIQAQMAQRQINGLSLAVINNGRIDARAYGVTSRGGARVTTDTLFQAGSISKPVAAVGALRLVEQGALSLDADVNAKLKTWKVPENDFTRTEKVSLRRLLSHWAGLTVHGFPGYEVTERMPSVVDVLEGKGNTAAVRVDVAPGSRSRYSGGGYTVMQLLVTDVTGKPFPAYMREAVLGPIGMERSTYEQPLPADTAA